MTILRKMKFPISLNFEPSELFYLTNNLCLVFPLNRLSNEDVILKNLAKLRTTYFFNLSGRGTTV